MTTANERWLSWVVETAPIAMVGIDAAGTITMWNRGAQALFGHAPDAVRGEPATDVVAEEHRARFTSMLERAAAGATLRDRPSVWLTAASAPMEVALTLWPGGSEAGDVAVVAREMTEERWLSSMLDGSLETLRGALDDARTAEATTRRFLADVAHQLRTPITGIQASAEVLAGGHTTDDATRDRLLGNIVFETARAGRLMASILRMARIDQGEPVRCAPTDVAALCETTTESFRVRTPRLRFAVDATGVRGPHPAIDGHVAEEILSNVLDNARRHARHEVTVAVRTTPSGVEFEVADDGPGLPAGREQAAFDRFVSLDSAGGSGLGLAVARSLARAHGGDVRWSGRSFLISLAG